MNKKFWAVLLCFALFAAAFLPTASADSTGVCFTAADDKLLDLGYSAVSSGGVYYVPAQAFSYCGVRYTYFSSRETGLLGSDSVQIFFDLSAGTCYDSQGTYYNLSPIFHSGQLYVPVGWTCQRFGLSYSVVNGSGYGDVIRIKDGREVLPDDRFLDAAKGLMSSYYNQYFGNGGSNGGNGGGTVVTPQPTVAPIVTPAPENGGSGTAALCFIGLPDTALLDQLSAHNCKACFFLTAEEAASAPDLVRRIYGSGQALGVYCASSAERECQAAVDAIFDAAQVRPTLLTSPPAISKACAEYAGEHALAYYAQRNAFSASTASASTVTAKLQNNSSRVTLTLTCGAGTSRLIGGLLSYISEKGISVSPLRETDL